MNKEKLAKLQEQVRIGGKGSARRKKKVVHRSSATDDKKLQNSLKKLTVNNISGIEEVGAGQGVMPRRPTLRTYWYGLLRDDASHTVCFQPLYQDASF